LKRASPDFFMRDVFFIVGPTATGKSEIAAAVAGEIDAEIVSADALQIYGDLNLLNAKPDPATLAKVPHHLVGTVSILEEMNAKKFRKLALQAINEIHSRGKVALVVGGSGLYVKALTHGLSVAPSADPDLRARLNELSLVDLQTKLSDLDPNTSVDLKNRRRVVRAIEICLLSGKRASEQRTGWVSDVAGEGVFVFRERDDLYQRINLRVEKMFDAGVIEEVRAASATSETASKMIGFGDIRDLLDGKMSIPQCVAAIQRATRRYAKRQLTWFRRQTNFQSLNLSLLTTNEAVKWISQKACLAFAQEND
jgi:tRNA dimethylallyltransferase